MKKWARTAAAVLSAVMMFSVTACGNKVQDPREAMDAAVEKNAGLDSMDMDMNMKMHMSQGGQNLDISMDMNMKMADINKDTMRYLGDTKTSMAGQSVEMTIFYTDGYYYMDVMGQKIKYPMDLTQLMETVKKSTQSSTLTSEQMTDVTLKEEGDNTILTFTADPEKMNTYLKDAMGSMSGAGIGTENMEMTIREASGSYTVNKEGYYTDMILKMSFDMTVQGQTVAADIEMTGSVNDPGQPVDVELPSTDGYTEVDPAALTAA